MATSSDKADQTLRFLKHSTMGPSAASGMLPGAIQKTRKHCTPRRSISGIIARLLLALLTLCLFFEIFRVWTFMEANPTKHLTHRRDTFEHPDILYERGTVGDDIGNTVDQVVSKVKGVFSSSDDSEDAVNVVSEYAYNELNREIPRSELKFAFTILHNRFEQNGKKDTTNDDWIREQIKDVIPELKSKYEYAKRAISTTSSAIASTSFSSTSQESGSLHTFATSTSIRARDLTPTLTAEKRNDLRPAAFDWQEEHSGARADSQIVDSAKFARDLKHSDTGHLNVKRRGRGGGGGGGGGGRGSDGGGDGGRGGANGKAGLNIKIPSAAMEQFADAVLQVVSNFQTNQKRAALPPAAIPIGMWALEVIGPLAEKKLVEVFTEMTEGTTVPDNSGLPCPLTTNSCDNFIRPPSVNRFLHGGYQKYREKALRGCVNFVIAKPACIERYSETEALKPIIKELAEAGKIDAKSAKGVSVASDESNFNAGGNGDGPYTSKIDDREPTGYAEKRSLHTGAGNASTLADITSAPSATSLARHFILNKRDPKNIKPKPANNAKTTAKPAATTTKKTTAATAAKTSQTKSASASSKATLASSVVASTSGTSKTTAKSPGTSPKESTGKALSLKAAKSTSELESSEATATSSEDVLSTSGTAMAAATASSKPGMVNLVKDFGIGAYGGYKDQQAGGQGTGGAAGGFGAMAGKYMDQRNGNGQPVVPSPGSPGSTNGDLPVPNDGVSDPNTVSPEVQDPANQADGMTGTTGPEGSMSPQPLQGNPNGIQPINAASSIAPIQDPNVNSNGAGVAGTANPMPPVQGSLAPAATAVVGMKHADTVTLNQDYSVENTVGGQTPSNLPVSPQNPPVGAAAGVQTYNNPPAPAPNPPVGNNGGILGQSNLPPSAATPPGGTTPGGSAMVEPIAQGQAGSSGNSGGGSGFVDPVAQAQTGSNPNAGGGSAIVDPVAQAQAQAQAKANAPGGAGNSMIAGTAQPTQLAGSIPAKPVATAQGRSGGLQKRVYTPETPSSVGTGTGLGGSDAASLPSTAALGFETQRAGGAMASNDRTAGVGASADQENVASSPTAVPSATGYEVHPQEGATSSNGAATGASEPFDQDPSSNNPSASVGEQHGESGYGSDPEDISLPVPPNKSGAGPGASPDKTYGDEPNEVGAADPESGYEEFQFGSAGGVDEQGTGPGPEYNASPSPSDTGMGGLDQDPGSSGAGVGASEQDAGLEWSEYGAPALPDDTGIGSHDQDPDAADAGSGAVEQGAGFGTSGYDTSPSSTDNGMGDNARFVDPANTGSHQTSTSTSDPTGDYESPDPKGELSDQPVDSGSSEYESPTSQGDDDPYGYGISTLPDNSGSGGSPQGADPAGLDLPPHPGSQPLGDPNQAFPGGDGEELTSPGVSSTSSGNDPYSSGTTDSTGNDDQTSYDSTYGNNRQHTNVASSEYGTSGMPGDNGSPSGSMDEDGQAQFTPTDEMNAQSTDFDPSEYGTSGLPGEDGSGGAPQGADSAGLGRPSGPQPVSDETPVMPDDNGMSGVSQELYPPASTGSSDPPITGNSEVADNFTTFDDPTGFAPAVPPVNITPTQSELQGSSPLSLAPVPSATINSAPSAAGSSYLDETDDAGTNTPTTPNSESGPSVYKRTPTSSGSSVRPSTESGSSDTGGLSPPITHNGVVETNPAGIGSNDDEVPVPSSPSSDSGESRIDAYDNAMTPLALIEEAASYVSQAYFKLKSSQPNDPTVQEMHGLTVRLDAILQYLKAGDSGFTQDKESAPSPGGSPAAGTSPSSLIGSGYVNIVKRSALPPASGSEPILRPPGPAPPSSVDGYPSGPAVPQSKAAVPKGSQTVGLMITRLIEAANSAISAFELTNGKQKHKEKNPVYKNLKKAKASALAAQDANNPLLKLGQKSASPALDPTDAGNESCSEGESCPGSNSGPESEHTVFDENDSPVGSGDDWQSTVGDDGGDVGTLDESDKDAARPWGTEAETEAASGSVTGQGPSTGSGSGQGRQPRPGTGFGGAWEGRQTRPGGKPTA